MSAVVEKVKRYLEAATIEGDVYNAWSEGFICGLVKMREWGITEDEYDELMAWLQENKKPYKVDGPRSPDEDSCS